MQTVQDYMAKIRELTGWYWAGTYGQVGTETLWTQKSKQVGVADWYKAHPDAKAKGMGKKVADCCGVDKYARWVKADGSVPYDASTDLNQEMLFDLCKNNNLPYGAISTMPEQEGLIVWKQGHMGIYLGGGKVKEARGGSDGIVTTNLKERGWTHWFTNPYLDYEEVGMYLEKGVKGEEVGIWQRYLKSKGYDLGNFGPNKDGIDNSFGGAMVTVQAKWEKDNKRTVDSKVDLSDCLFALDKISNELLTANALLSKERQKTFYLDAEIAERQSRLSKAEDELFIAYQKTADVEAKLSNKLSELETIRKQLFDALKRVSDLELMIDNLEDSNGTLKEQVDAANTKNINLQVENERLRKELKNAELPLPFEPVEDEPDYSIADLLKMIVDRIFKKN